MVIVTVTKWKQKLFFLLAALVVIVGMSLAVSNVAPSSGELEEDIYTQPVRVQGEIR
ncbi:MAG TPA: hypothetical protein PLJ33_01735 [Peptococcaceae bacterium]|jgi:uncharacterized protein YpmS|nr:hypothetical protein [Clostridia bacterium]HOB81472.1 hypothetical protein [Peptococcaceae bacterium]HPZ72002.1 hypothetical protein [Peptococcaceae bacterium]HQD53560.1 hypothetical protein [Peptococcaceae bacterium]